MRHFGHLAPRVRDELFHLPPAEFDAAAPLDVLAPALGATLYSPATRPRLAADVRRQAARGVVSMVLCLEDAIPDGEVGRAEANLVAQLTALAAEPTGAPGSGPLPLLFVRVRTPGQITALVTRLGPAVRVLTGFVLPKFTECSGIPFLEALTEAEAACGRRLLAMPVLESPDLLHLETRTATLDGIARTVTKYRDRVLALRLGVTDLCAAYGLRRAPGTTAYDIALLAALIGDVVNVLGRADGTGFTLTGPVWEYFPRRPRTPGPRPPGGHLDGLLREVELDHANGLLGKTCIHPSHIAPVHALSVVTHEEFCDATDITGPGNGGGVLRSAYTNKMNEVKPHRAWAERTLRRARAFGVARPDVTLADLLAAGTPAPGA